MVVAARDEVLGERPVAYVIPAGPGHGPELGTRCGRRATRPLPRPKRPAMFWLVAELPVGPTGKVAWRRLRELAAVPG